MHETATFFDDLSDSADRVQTTASKLASVQGVFIQNGATADEAGNVMQRLRVKIDAAMEGNEEAIKAFDKAGISLDYLKTVHHVLRGKV